MELCNANATYKAMLQERGENSVRGVATGLGIPFDDILLETRDGESTRVVAGLQRLVGIGDG